MPSKELDTFYKGLQRLDRTRRRMEELYAERQIIKMDIESVYEALFIRSMTGFEGYLEQLFVAILMGQTNHPRSRANRLMEVNTRTNLINIIRAGNDFLDWLPYHKTERRAGVYLKDGRPFTELDNGDRAKIKSMTVIRNAIAHRSDHSKKEFKKITSSISLLRAEKQPAGFLRSRLRTLPSQSRFEVYLAELGSIAAKLHHE